MALGVLEDSLVLRGTGIEAGIGGVDAIPMVTIEDGIIIGRRCIVTEHFRTGIPAVDIDPLGVVLALGGLGIVVNPFGEVVVADVEQVIDLVLADETGEHLLCGEVLKVGKHAAGIVYQR